LEAVLAQQQRQATSFLVVDEVVDSLPMRMIQIQSSTIGANRHRRPKWWRR
jgi:hypothetical protein